MEVKKATVRQNLYVLSILKIKTGETKGEENNYYFTNLKYAVNYLNQFLDIFTCDYVRNDGSIRLGAEIIEFKPLIYSTAHRHFKSKHRVYHHAVIKRSDEHQNTIFKFRIVKAEVNPKRGIAKGKIKVEKVTDEHIIYSITDNGKKRTYKINRDKIQETKGVVIVPKENEELINGTEDSENE